MTKASDQYERKAKLRAEAQARRRALPDKDVASQEICETLAARPEYAAARTVLFYVHFGDEVRTQDFLAETLERAEKRVTVPYCVGRRLELFQLANVGELAEGTFTILEPRPELRDRPDRRVEITDVDLVVVPGVAFDARGGRLGHGQGFYDRLLKHARPDTTLVALAFECQMFAEIPVGSHDVRMDRVITEKHVYQAKEQ